MKKISSLTLLPIMALVSACNSADVCEQHTIYMHAHRGEPYLAPQNTAESIKLAFELGARMIETDFSITKNGTMFCMHGPRELKNLWGIEKPIDDITEADIKSSRLIRPQDFDAKYANCKIPTIDEVFASIPKDKYMELEIKKYGESFADKVEAARKKAGLDYNNIIVTSFNPEWIKDFKSKYPQYETLYILVYPFKGERSAEDVIQKAKEAGASQVAIGNYRKIDRAYVKKIQDAGLKVGIWQVQNLDDLAYAAKIGVNRVCSDYASRLRGQYRAVKSLNFE